MNSEEIETWATAYIAFEQDPHRLKENHPLFWAAERFMPGRSVSADDCWLAILAILSRSPPETVIEALAAGALEDLIDDFGPQFIDRIELETRRNPAFRHLLGGVWESSTSAIWARIEAARNHTHW